MIVVTQVFLNTCTKCQVIVAFLVYCRRKTFDVFSECNLFSDSSGIVWMGPKTQLNLLSVFYIFEVFSNVRSVLSQCNTRLRLLIAVFNIKRTLKFKPQPTVYVFHCRQSSKRTSRETEAHFSWVKRSRSILFFSVFKGLLAVAIILIDGREKANRQLGFELQSSHVIEKQ